MKCIPSSPKSLFDLWATSHFPHSLTVRTLGSFPSKYPPFGDPMAAVMMSTYQI